MHFLDTCTCVDFLRGRLEAGYQLMRSGRPGDFGLPAIVVAELFFGAEHSANPSREVAVVAEFVEAFQVIAFDADAAREYGRIRQLLGSQGQIIGDRDIMIVASCLANGATLVTRNVGEFLRVPGLKLESWADEPADPGAS